MPDEVVDPSNLSVTNVSDSSIAAVPSEPDAKTQTEIDDWDAQEKRARISGVVQDIAERKKYAQHIFWLVAAWLGLMGWVLLAQGFNFHYFDLREAVLIAVVTTTTAGVVGLLLVVVKYLFPSH